MLPPLTIIRRFILLKFILLKFMSLLLFIELFIELFIDIDDSTFDDDILYMIEIE